MNDERKELLILLLGRQQKFHVLYVQFYVQLGFTSVHVFHVSFFLNDLLYHFNRFDTAEWKHLGKIFVQFDKEFKDQYFHLVH
jgi:hypothetical protein